MKVKVISDGTRNGTRLVNDETGEDIENVRSITWSIAEVADNEADEAWGAAWLTKMVVTFVGVEAELVGVLSNGAEA